MLASIHPFIAAELDYRRDRIMADFEGSRRRSAMRRRRVPRVPTSELRVPRVIRRALVGH
jgi:hypothetical protein